VNWAKLPRVPIQPASLGPMEDVEARSDYHRALLSSNGQTPSSRTIALCCDRYSSEVTGES